MRKSKTSVQMRSTFLIKVKNDVLTPYHHPIISHCGRSWEGVGRSLVGRKYGFGAKGKPVRWQKNVSSAGGKCICGKKNVFLHAEK